MKYKSKMKQPDECAISTNEANKVLHMLEYKKNYYTRKRKDISVFKQFLKTDISLTKIVSHLG